MARRKAKTAPPARSDIPAATGPYSDDLAYLEHELLWVEHRCRRLEAEQKLACVQAGEELDTFSDRELTPAMLRSRARFHGKTESEVRACIDQRLAASRAADHTLAVDKLCTLHALSADERIILIASASPCFSQKFDDLFEEISSGYGNGTCIENLFTFLGYGFADRIRKRRLFRLDAPLVKNDLITVNLGRSRSSTPDELLQATVRISSRALSFIVGDALPPDDMMEWSSVERPVATLDQVVLDKRDKQRIVSVVEHHDDYLRAREAWGFDKVIRYGRGLLMLFHGKPGTGKTMMAHAVAHHMGKNVLNVDIPAFLDSRESDHFLPSLFREARLQDAVLFFDECESLFESRRLGNSLMTMLLTEIERFEGVAILATNLPEKLDEALDRRIMVKVRFPMPDRHARQQIWEKHLPSIAPLAAEVDTEALAARFEVAGGYIKNAVLMALAEAVHTGGPNPQITMAQLEAAVREQARPFDEDGDPLVVPKVRLTDVVLPESTRQGVTEVIDAARDRRTLLDRWGIGTHLTYGKGITALFHGPPGTGKTLCAEAVAGELNRPLMARSLAGLLSKWVGSSEHNATAMFADAKRDNAVLFLDEVDGLLSARRQEGAIHDNRLVNLLLTLIERHEGVVLMATNLPSHLDPALARRIGWRLSFPLPDAGQRAEIWRRLLPDTVPISGAIHFGRLGVHYELSGAGIRNAVFKAAYRAARGEGAVTQALLEAAAAEEAGGIGAPQVPMAFVAAGDA